MILFNIDNAPLVTVFLCSFSNYRIMTKPANLDCYNSYRIIS